MIGETADALQAEMQIQGEKLAELETTHQESKKQLAKVSKHEVCWSCELSQLPTETLNQDITSKHLERVETCLSDKIQGA
jgi:excinuclease UvrABC ATPase subunit